MFIRTVIFSVALAFSMSANADVTKEETFSFKISDGGSFSLSNVNGDVTITGGSGNTIEVLAIKKAGSQKQLDEIEIEISESANSVEIETDLPSSKRWFKWGNDGAEVTYEVTVPSGINLESIETVNGEVEIRGVSGDVSASTVNGEINLEDLAADAEMDTVNGTINASFAKLEGQQKVKASTVNGRMTLRLPADADVDVNADTLNGEISAGDFDLEVDKGFVGSDINGKIGNGSARMNLDTVNGSIKIRKE